MIVFFFNDTATTEIYTLSLHDALPISEHHPARQGGPAPRRPRDRAPDPLVHPVERPGHRPAEQQGVLRARRPHRELPVDRKSTRLNSSHANISYAVFCLKKKKNYTLL